MYRDKIGKYTIKIVGKRDTKSYTAGGSAIEEVADRIEIAFGSNTLVTIEHPDVLPSGNLSNADGLLGAPLLGRFEAVIDLRSNTVTLGRCSESQPPRP